MDWLTAHYPAVRESLFASVPEFWPELNILFVPYSSDPLVPEIILPLAACRMVGGDTAQAIPVGAALTAAVISVRTIDDLLDQDRPAQLWEQVGPARAWNYAMGAKHLSYQILHDSALPPYVVHRISQLFTRAFLRVASGQDQLLSGGKLSFESYWRTMELRTANAYGAACASGALVGTDDLALVDCCAQFGHHLGLVMQILNDIEAIWAPKLAERFDLTVLSLPVVFGLASTDPAGEQLRDAFSRSSGPVERAQVRSLLNLLGTGDYLLQMALREREQALVALSTCPDGPGKEALSGYITGLFGDLDQLRLAFQ